MFKHLTLSRPLAVIDLETTGTNPQTDRIVEISVLKALPEAGCEQRTQRICPGIPIPAAASAVHGIFDRDVAGSPTFGEVAPSFAAFLDDCDLCGFNVKRFDLRLLQGEFRRAGVLFDLAGRAIIDPLEIFHAFERRDLSAAVRFYLGREHEARHSAAGDVLATAEVLDAMLARYQELPRAVSGLHVHFKDPDTLDSNGCFRKVEGQIRFAMGKFRGQPLDVVARDHPDYLRWMLKGDFFEDAKEIVRRALEKCRVAEAR